MKDKRYVISLCLLGVKCRFRGDDKRCLKAVKLVSTGKGIGICPEQLAGFPTPRLPVEIKKGRVFDKQGKDVTAKIKRGLKEAMKIVNIYRPTHALLKDKSALCGCRHIFDGLFSEKLINGKGLFAEKLEKKGVILECQE